MAGIVEQLAALQSGLAQVQAALGSHTRVPEMRRGTVTSLSPAMVLIDGDTVSTAVTGSDAALWVGARARVQVQGRDRWVVSVAPISVTPTLLNGWVAYTGYAAPKAYLDGSGWVRFEGAVTNPTAVTAYPSNILSVPVPFRPVTGLPRFIGISYATTGTTPGIGDMYVNPANGVLSLARSSGTNGGAYLTTLDQVRYRAA